MSSETMQAPPMPDDAQSVEQYQFIPTPERVSQYLEDIRAEQVAEMLQSVEGRQELFNRLVEHEEDLQEIYPSFDAEELRVLLDAVGDSLQQQKQLLSNQPLGSESPEQAEKRKGLFRKSLDRIKGFAVKHPIISALLVAALITASIAGGYYLSANIEGILTKVGLGHLYGEAGASAAIQESGRLMTGGTGAAETMAEGMIGGSTAAEAL